MTTQKQVAANKANAQKSTGPKTPAGKAAVAKNALRHGILSTSLFLEGEDPADFTALQDELQQSLQPVGCLEMMLVEKIAIAAWKQRRMIAAETASIEMNRTMLRPDNRRAVGDAMGLNYFDQEISPDEIEPMSQEELETLEWCNDVLAEFKAMGATILVSNDLAALAKEAPCFYGQFETEAEDEALTPEAYLASLNGGLLLWADGLLEWCEEYRAAHARRSLVQLIAQWVQAEKSAPISNELLMRYQVALDGELYRAVNALRKQQEWRLKAGAVGTAAAGE